MTIAVAGTSNGGAVIHLVDRKAVVEFYGELAATRVEGVARDVLVKVFNVLIEEYPVLDDPAYEHAQI